MILPPQNPTLGSAEGLGNGSAAVSPLMSPFAPGETRQVLPLVELSSLPLI